MVKVQKVAGLGKSALLDCMAELFRADAPVPLALVAMNEPVIPAMDECLMGLQAERLPADAEHKIKKALDNEKFIAIMFDVTNKTDFR